MNEISVLRLNLLRAMYLFIAVGLGVVVWPSIVFPSSLQSGPDTVVRSLLGAMGLLSLLGLRYPVHMLPLLMFEFAWKVIWIVAVAVPMATRGGLDSYATETLFACGLGVALLLLVLPWGFIGRHYFRAAAMAASSPAR